MSPSPDSETRANALPDAHYMRMAVAQAVAAADAGEVPVGAIIVKGGRILGRAHNQVETLRDPTAHAELLSITQAAEAVGDWRLEECTLYVTKEPCAMCAGAIVLARLARIVYGAPDPVRGGAESVFNILSHPNLNHQPVVESGLMADDCRGILQEFFRARRG